MNNDLTIAYEVLDKIEEQLRSSGGNIMFDISLDLSSYYEDQFDSEKSTPTISYSPKEGLYYFSFGPRQTPGKRPYPTRLLNGIVAESQPEWFYSTVQAVDFAPIIERVNDVQFYVWPDSMKGWPKTAPFYLYLGQKDQGSGENISQEWDAMYRYVKISGKTKVKVIGVDYETGLITLAEPLLITVPDEATEEWEDYQVSPLIFAFFNYRIDHLLDSELILFTGDETHKSITLKERTSILEVENLSTIKIEVADVYSNNNSTYVFLQSDIPTPSVGTPVLILVRADSGTILSYKEVKIKNASLIGIREELLYDEIDGANPFIEINDRFVTDPFEVIPEPEEGLGNIPPVPDLEPTGKVVYRKYRVNITPYVDTLEEDQDFAYFERVQVATATVSDEELSIPLHATRDSFRPHNYHTLEPLKAPAYSDAYNYNWAAPLPYPEKTFVEDCDEPIVNGFWTPEEVSKKRLSYRRDRNSWFIGGTVFCVCKNFQDANSVEDCIVNRNFEKYFKLGGISGHNLYHLAFSKW